jgi:conjugative relaxase-like TrwC/TraI family protein
VRFTITPLGSAGGRSLAQVVDDIVRYLDGPTPPSTPAPGQPSGSEAGASRYYADGNAEPGRWLGNGAAEMGLRGSVDGQNFARVLAGRDPRTGVRLLSARGSAGRRPTLARGTQTRWDSAGEPLYDTKDAATALGLEVREVEGLVAAGERLAVEQFVGLPGSRASRAPEFGGEYLVPTTDAEGSRWIRETELQRCEAARAGGPDPEAVAAAGCPDDQLSLADAARVAGVSARYLRSLCRKWEQNRGRIAAALATGEDVPRAFLVAYRGTKGQWLVKRADLVDYLRHRVQPAVRVAYDLTLTTEKSLGVLALLGDDRTRAAALRTIQAGNDRGLAHLEYAAAMARAKGEPVSTRGWTVASFRHLTSRALDPFPHHHNVIANAVIDEEDARRALDARWLYRHASAASALATAEMRHRLTAELGVRWRRGRKGGWEIDGIPDEVLREFSRRSNEIDDAVAELEALIGRTKTIGELRGLVTKTRPAKRRVETDDLVADWWCRANALGFKPRHLARCVHAPSAEPPACEPDVIFDRLAGPAGLCAGGSVFTRGEVIAALVDMDISHQGEEARPLLLPADEVERLADEFLACDLVVELLSPEERKISALATEPLFTTAEMLSVQGTILQRFRAGRSTGAALVQPVDLDAAIATDEQLSHEQRALVHSFCTRGHRFQCAIGRAGSGKTTAMRAAAAAWAATGYRVVGTAVKAEAARHLGTETSMPTETLAWHLAHTDPATSPLDARTVLIVDEASTISDRDLNQLLWLCEATGAAVRLIGDPDQHGAVGAGGMFRVLCRDAPEDTPELRTSHRVTNTHDRAAADALRDGRVADALAELEAAGHLHVVTDEIDLYLDLLDRWWQSRRDGAEHPMVDRRNHTRWQLNRLAHRLLQLTGEVGTDEIAAAHDRRFAVGDRVVARKGDRTVHPADRPHDYVRNGALGTITSVRPHRNHKRDVIRVAFDGIGEIDLPREFFDEHRRPGGRTDVGLDHAYAVTSYAVQGATFTESTSRIDENASRSETYVDITRGRSANHLYLTRSADPLDGERLPKAPPPAIAASVTARLSGSGPERAAVDVDPGAPAANKARATMAVSELHAQALNGTPPEAAVLAATELHARQVARLAARTLDPSVLSELPPRSHVPYLARRWDTTIADLRVFLARWSATPGGSGHWNWALGPRDGVPDQARDRQRVVARVTDLTAATVAEEMRQVGRALPDWARAHLAYHAARGTCVHDVHKLCAVYERVAAYRVEAHVAADQRSGNIEDVVFGSPPDDPSLRMRRRVLIDEVLPRDVAARPEPARTA